MFSWNNFLGKLTNNLLGIVNITNDSFSDDDMVDNKTNEMHEVMKFGEYKLNIYGTKEDPAFVVNEICNIL